MKPSKHVKQHNYRLLLSIVFCILVLVGFVFALTPFIMTVFNNDKLLNNNDNQFLLVKLADMKKGDIKKFTVGYIPVWIYKRRQEEIVQLSQFNTLLSDPLSKHSVQSSDIRNSLRSHLDHYFVFKPMESIRSCNIRYLDNPDSKLSQRLSDKNLSWMGGFTESCFGSIYDLSGRRFNGTGKNKQKNLTVPAYSVQQGDVIQFEFKLMGLQ